MESARVGTLSARMPMKPDKACAGRPAPRPCDLRAEICGPRWRAFRDRARLFLGFVAAQCPLAAGRWAPSMVRRG
jgi:hypothetical protein